MLKSLLLYLSKSKRAPDFIMRFGFTQRTAHRFIAGEKLEDALNALRTLNQSGRMVTVTHLGEDVTTPEEATNYAKLYLPVLDWLNKEGIKSDISIKLTQIGQYFDKELAYNNLRIIVDYAKQLSNFVWLDMMEAAYTSSTLEIYQHCLNDTRNIGVAIQANLLRSKSDLDQLFKIGATIRLCKGSFKESTDIAYSHKNDINANYKSMTNMLLDEKIIEKGVYPAIATHDPQMIQHAIEVATSRGISKEYFEFQMLNGIGTDLQKRLVDEGYRVRIYVPYGKLWYQYFMRRLAERPANLLLFFRNLV